MSESQVGEALLEDLRFLKQRFDEVSIRFQPLSMCSIWALVPQERILYRGETPPCPAPPEPWRSSLVTGAYKFRFVDRHEDLVECRTLLYRGVKEGWQKLRPLAAEMGLLLESIPEAALRDNLTWRTLMLPNEDGWRWFCMVFELALRPHHGLLAVDNSDRGGWFWWKVTQGPLFYARDWPGVREWAKETGYYGAAITDMARQSALAISLILDRLGHGAKHSPAKAGAAEEAPPLGGKKFTKEAKAMWWYEWLCESHGEEVPENVAYDLLRKLATEKKVAIFPPWSPHQIAWPSVNISFETFEKYLSRVRNSRRLPVRSVDSGSVIRSTPRRLDANDAGGRFQPPSDDSDS